MFSPLPSPDPFSRGTSYFMVAYCKQKKDDIKLIAWNIIDDRLLHV